MLFIRTSDHAGIATHDGVIKFSKEKRKGNTAKKFYIQNNEIVFIEEELLTRMIPKNSRFLLDENPIKIITTSIGNSLVFQDIDNSVSFLKINDETGIIEKVKFEDIVANEDAILCYDENSDWYIDDVESVLMIWGDTLNRHEIEDDFFNKIEHFSDYIINSENGMILNNILII